MTIDQAVSMTAAEFRITRERLGVPGDWLATELGVTERTVRRWENGSSTIPTGVVEQLSTLVATTEDFIGDVVAQLRKNPMLDGDGAQWVTTYASDAAYREEQPDLSWPAGWHRAAMGRVAERAPSVRITFVGDPT